MTPFSPSVARPFTRRAGLVMVSSLLVAGCNPGSDLPLLPPSQEASYRLGIGDQVRILVFGEDQLTGEYRVDDRGRMSIPLLGSIAAAGLTPQELEKSIALQLKQRDLLRDPSVSVEVVTYRPVFVLGEVARPGQYPYQPGMTVLTAVAIAGGYTYRAVQGYVSVIRTRDGEAVTGKALPGAFLIPGDVITVYERVF